jgi:hypothetical protein
MTTRTRATRSRARSWRRVRGTVAVAALLLSAADHLAAALAGIPPLGYMARRAGGVLADEWRSATRSPRPGRPIVIRVTTTPKEN